MKDQNQRERAFTEYNSAEVFASEANQAAENSREAHTEYLDQKDRLQNWKNIMSTAPITVTLVIFVIVSIGEYLISREIYREFNDQIPWVIAVAFFAAGVYASELLVYKFYKSKRDWKFYELRRDGNNNRKTVDELNRQILKHTNNNFIGGVVLSLALITGIGFLSYQRVQEEIGSGLRDNSFGIMDIMPILLYVVEIFCGMFIVYFVKKTSLSLKVKKLYNRFDKEAIKCNSLNTAAIDKFNDAESEGYSPLENPISDNIKTAFYRNREFTLDDKSALIQIPNTMTDYLNLNLVNTDDQPLKAHVDIVTLYQGVGAGGTDSNGNVTIKIEKTFPNDSCKQIFIRTAANTENKTEINGNFDLDENNVHKIIVKNLN